MSFREGDLMKRLRHQEHVGFGYGVLAALMYATMATFVKLSYDVNNETIIFFRNLLCFVMLFPVLLYKKQKLISNKLPLHLLRSFTGLLAIYAYYYAIKHLELTNAILLATTIPLFTPLVVLIWLRCTIPFRRVFALFVGFIGVVLVLQPESVQFQFASLVGLSAGVFAAIALVTIRQLSKTEPTERIMFYFFLSSTVISFFPMMLVYEPIDVTAWIYIAAIGLSGIFFQFFITKAFTYAPATKVSSLMYLNVVFGGIASWLFFDQVPNFWLIVGASLVILGGLIAIWEKKDPLKMR